MKLRVMTFNLRYGTADDGENRWDRRKELALRTIEAFGPDVLGAQECVDFQADFLRERLPGYGYLGAGRDDGRRGGEMAPLLFRKDAFEAVAGGHFWLSDDPHLPGSRSWGSAFPRMTTWAALRHKGGRVVWFFNTHFDHASAPAREEAARLLRGRVDALAGAVPAVVTGDFNADEGSAPYRLLRDGPGGGDPLVDAYRAAHPARSREDGTFHDFTGTRRGERIDWIFTTRHFRAAEVRIDPVAEGGRYPSDHFPVCATLELAD